MKLRMLNKIISVSLIIILVSHITFLHNIMQDYVLCKGADGHVAVENIEETYSCPNSLSFEISIYTGQSIFNVNSCEDTRFDENCIEESEFIPQSNSNSTIDLTSNCEIVQPTKNTFKNYKFIVKDLFDKNYILQNYTTVSLLI